MEFFETLQQVQSNWQPYKKWEFEQQKKEKQKIELIKKYPPNSQDLKDAKQYGRTIVNAINIMDKHSIDKSEDASVNAGYKMLLFAMMSTIIGATAGSVLGITKAAKKIPDMKPYWMPLGMLISTAISMPILNIWLAGITKQASRIARFQTRENDLKDHINFIVYNDEQITEAGKIAKTLPDIKENRRDKLTKDDFNTIKAYKKTKKTADSLKKDAKKYNIWKEKYLKKEEKRDQTFKNLTPSKSAVSKAEKDRDKLLNTVKKIENKSLEYYNNMEMAAHVIIAGATLASAAVGLGMTGLIKKLQKKKPGLKYNKTLNILQGVPLIAGVIAPTVLLAPINKLIKNAARIGRFKAKQELLKNPDNFIAYDDEQKKTIPMNDIPKKQPKGLFGRFKEDLKAIKQLQNDTKEYEKYMDTLHKDELKLHKSLKQIKISDKQNNDAANLQKQAFYSFEKMDEKAQRFTDDTDAAVNSTLIVSGSIISLAVRVLSVYLCGKEIKKINGNKVPNHIGEVLKLAFFSGKLKGKTMAIMLMPFILPNIATILMGIKGVQIKKDAGKIGIMTAMQDLEDPKNFLPEKIPKPVLKRINKSQFFAPISKEDLKSFIEQNLALNSR